MLAILSEVKQMLAQQGSSPGTPVQKRPQNRSGHLVFPAAVERCWWWWTRGAGEPCIRAL